MNFPENEDGEKDVLVEDDADAAVDVWE